MTANELQALANHYRDMAWQISDPETVAALREFADRYEIFATAAARDVKLLHSVPIIPHEGSEL